MKCPIDQTEMEKGRLAAYGVAWTKGDTIKIPFLSNIMRSKVTYVIAWKCPKCGKVELKIEENK